MNTIKQYDTIKKQFYMTLKHIYGVLWLCLLTVSSHAQSLVPDSIQDVIEKSGDNKKSLLSLLEKYKNNKEKFSAACFLINGMRYHEQGGRVLSYDTRIDSLCQTADKEYYSIIQGKSVEEQESNSILALLKKRSDEASKRNAELTFQEPEIEGLEMPDSRFVSGEKIEWVINHAFSLRQRFPRLKRLPLQTFFEYVLPYRTVNGYPLLTDYKTLYERFNKYLQVGASINVEQLAETYNRTIEWLRRWNGPYPYDTNIGLNDLYWSGFHDCVDMAYYCASILRACGVPAVVEYNAAYRVKQGRHFMVNVLDDKGKWVAFSPENGLPSTAEEQMQDALNIFRQHFSPQKNNPAALKMEDECIPDDFDDICTEDVSRLYHKTQKITIQTSSLPSDNALAYLATFKPGIGLTPVTWGLIDHKKNEVAFDNVVPNNIYYPVFCNKAGFLIPFSAPFRMKKDGTYIPYDFANGKTLSNVMLIRKYPYKPHLMRNINTMIGTCVLASNRNDFQEADTIGMLMEVPKVAWTDLHLNTKRAYQYYRVRAPQNHPHLYMSEIQFLTLKNYGYANTAVATSLKGVPDSASQYVQLLDASPEIFFSKPEYDGNVLTSPYLYPDVTLRLKEAQKVERLRFIVMNADNGIRPNDHYILRHWTANGWQILWEGVAQSNSLSIDNLKTETFYWLSNTTRGQEELPFFLTDKGEQVFPHQIFLEENDKGR